MLILFYIIKKCSHSTATLLLACTKIRPLSTAAIIIIFFALKGLKKNTVNEECVLNFFQDGDVDRNFSLRVYHGGIIVGQHTTKQRRWILYHWYHRKLIL